MCSVVLDPAQIFGLIQMQSKSNPSAQKGLPHNPIIHKSSYVQCNTNKSTLVICSFWSISVHFSPLGLLQSIWSIQSTLFNRSCQSILVHFRPLGTLQSIRSFWFTSVYLVHFVESGPVRSNLDQLLENLVLLVQFSPFCPLQSIVPKQTLSWFKHA